MNDPYRTEVPWLDQLLSDQSRCWQQGDRVLVEAYQAQHPELHANTEAILVLIRQEVRCRTDLGEQPELKEYLDRFPHLETRLREQFKATTTVDLDPLRTLPPEPPGSTQPPMSDHLEAICDRFEDAWRAVRTGGLRPRLEEFLAGITEPVLQTLLIELLGLEIDYRRQLEQTPALEEYQQRFPALPSEWLAQALTTKKPLGTPPQHAEDRQQPATPDLLSIPGYDILGVLGQGGMGAVFHGRDHDLGREVAVKVLLDKLQDQAEFLRRFVEEAQICGQLQHPGVVPVYELGKLNNQQPYFTMKLVKGKTLSQLLKERAQASEPGRPMQDLPRFLTIFGQVCQAMAYAHAHGVIHRDLKPGNVMVGAFGEVQVMDWGLAKILPRVSTEALGEDPPVEELTAIRTTQNDGIPAGTSNPRTGTGHVLGTPAYMPPEQARGEIQHLDQRCDVFALGSILCQLLTGKPAYRGGSAVELQRQAANGDLADATTRLDSCGADAELIGLVRRCLQPERANRPGAAAEVAAAVTAYQEWVQARAEEERRGREVAQVRAEEEVKRRELAQARAQVEQQRRRLTVALAASLLLLVSGVGGAALYYQHEQAAEIQRQTELDGRRKYLNTKADADLAEGERPLDVLHKKLADPIQTAGLLSNLDEWQKLLDDTQVALKQAQSLADGSPELLEEQTRTRLERLGRKLPVEKELFSKVKQLDTIRLEAETLVEGKYDPSAAGPKYEHVFVTKLGLDLKNGQIDRLGQQVKQSPLRYALVAALDYWAQVTTNPKLRPRLLEVARQADPDDWRDQVRDVQTGGNLERLKELAGKCQYHKQTPQILGLLASRLNRKDSQEKAGAFLREALLHHPKDFWLHFDLGNVVQEPAEMAGCYRAALALRPNSSMACNNLSNALRELKNLEGAVAACKKAIALDPTFAGAHHSLGNALLEQKNLEGAVAAYQKAIALDPTFAMPHSGLGNVLRAQKNLEGAVAAHKEAIALDPKFAMPHYNLGNALHDLKDLEGAIASYKEAIALDPTYAMPHIGLGNVLRDQKDLKGAVAAYQKAIALDLKFAMPHNNLGNALRDLKDLSGAVAAFNRAIALDPTCAPAHTNLGNALYDQKNLEGAVAALQKAIALDPKLAVAHNGLGNALRDQKNLEGAVAAYKEAIAFDPTYARPHYSLGNALRDQKDLKGAVAAFHKAIELNPKYAESHCNLGLVLRQQGQFAEALKALKLGHELGSQQPGWNYPSALWVKQCEQLLALMKAIELNPQDAKAHYNLGLALHAQNDLEGAAAAYKKVIELKPNFAWAHYNLGNALRDQKDLEGAVATYKKAIEIDSKFAEAHCNLGHLFRGQGRFAEAVKELQLGHQLGLKKPGWNYPSAQWVKQCEQLLVLDEKLPAVLAGQVQPKDAAEQLALANLCQQYKQQYAAATKFYADAFAADPKAADNLNGRCYNAACVAALAGAGQGKDADKLGPQELAKLRRQALDWLNTDLKLWQQQAQSDQPNPIQVLKLTMSRWLSDPNLARVREQKALAKLPKEEQIDWIKVWLIVEQLLLDAMAR